MIINPRGFKWPIPPKEYLRWDEFDGDSILLPGRTGQIGFVTKCYPDPAFFRKRRWYFPADNPTLFHKFHSFVLTKESIIEFAAKFGDLGKHYEYDFERNEMKSGDSWSDWKAELREFDFSYCLWMALKNNDESLLQSAYSEYRESGGRHPPGRITQERAWRDIGDHISFAFDRNTNGIRPKFSLNSEGAGVSLVFEPVSLIAFIWLQLAQAVTTSDRWKFCDLCGEPFKPESMKARYCSDSHRQMAYRKRKEAET